MESGNDYVLQVKGNQPKLLSAIQETIRNKTPVDLDYSLEKNRGRQENRAIYVYQQLKNPLFKEWYGSKTVVHVHSYGYRKNKKYEENRYYLCSLATDVAKYYNTGIRNHWGIENNLHWVKDVDMYEDKGMVRCMKLSETLSTIRNIVISLFRVNNYKSIKMAFERFCNRLDESLNLIENKNIINKEH